MSGSVNGSTPSVSETKRRTVRKAQKRITQKKPKAYCVCKGRDDGRPMLKCELCNDWFHFDCVNLTDREVEEIKLYVCPSCHESTGYSSIMEWEGPEVLELVDRPVRPLSPDPSTPELVAWSSGEESGGSGDEYVDEGGKDAKEKPLRKGRTRVESSDDEDSDSMVTTPKDAKPKPSLLKRKAASGGGASSPSKRPKKQPSESTPDDDPLRKFCLGKMKEILQPIFQKYQVFEPTVHEDGSIVDDEEQNAHEKRVEGLANKFVDELEHALFENYSEVDKQGKRTAAAKYKEHFRTLSFNLNKPDRTVLHRRIARNDLTAVELSKMTSADLANEQTKQDIVNQQKESLKQTILEETKAVPLAKRTHKGEEMIETFSQEVVRQQKEDEEKRERERMLRLRMPPPQISTGGPMSSVTETSGAELSPTREPYSTESLVTPLSASRPLFLPSASDFTPLEPSLNLSDLIDIDLPDSPKDGASPSRSPPSAVQTLSLPPTPVLTEPPPPVPSTPVASIPEPFRRTSFDLNALWSNSTLEGKKERQASIDAGTGDEPSSEMEESPNTVSFDMPTTKRADDGDFDMLLEEDPIEAIIESGPQKSLAERQAEAYAALPQVWSGTLVMPYDSTTTYTPLVNAKQVGGRSLNVDQQLWRTLFPTANPTIDGRVAVDQSAKYLIQSRLAVSKELIAVSLTPAGPEHARNYELLFDFLVAKNRHGLVFPWGKHPGGDSPGRELYIIPLPPSSALPEYLDLLDEMKLPQERFEKLLVAVWVLQKGKLGKPTTPPPQPSTTPVLPPPVAPMGPPASEPPKSFLSNLPPPPPTGPTVLPSVIASALASFNPQAQINLAALSEEVASLTPAQMEIVNRALSHAQIPSLPVPPVAVGPPQPPPPAFPPFPPTQTPLINAGQPIAQPSPPPPPPPIAPHAFPPAVPPPSGEWTTPPAPPKPLGYPSELEREPGRRGGRGHKRERSREDDFGGGGGRRRGGHKARGGDGTPDRPRDLGWGGRGRGRGHGSPRS